MPRTEKLLHTGGPETVLRDGGHLSRGPIGCGFFAAVLRALSRQRMGHLLQFGRFLEIAWGPSIPKNLTEWRFRGYWNWHALVAVPPLFQNCHRQVLAQES